MLKMKLVDIQKQVKIFQEQGIQLARVIDQCKSQKEAIQSLETQLAAEQAKVKDEGLKAQSLTTIVETLKIQHEEELRTQAAETEALRAQLAGSAGEMRRLRAIEESLRAELEEARRVTPPSEHMVRENAALRQRVQTLESVYCPYG
jgi:hypothetical protein